MRILMMADVPPNPDSGASGTEVQTALALRRLGHDVDCIWADHLSHRIRHGNLHSLLEQPRSYRTAMQAQMARARYDVVHVNQPQGYLAAKSLRRLTDRPVFVHRSHGFEPRVREVLRPWLQALPRQGSWLRGVASDALAALLERQNQAIAEYADGHVVSSSLCAQFLTSRYRVSTECVANIAQAAPALFGKTPAIALDCPRLQRLLYVGQLAFFKGPSVVAAAFERILAAYPSATLTWVCSAQHHGKAAELFGAQARTQVSFRDWCPQDALLRIYDEHGIFLFPSLFEGFGKAMIEAMTRGLAVVSSAEGGARDIIDHGNTGMLVPPGDAAAVAAAATSLMADPDGAIAMGARARAVGMQYTWDRVAIETAAFYQRLIDRKQ